MVNVPIELGQQKWSLPCQRAKRDLTYLGIKLAASKSFRDYSGLKQKWPAVPRRPRNQVATNFRVAMYNVQWADEARKKNILRVVAADACVVIGTRNRAEDDMLVSSDKLGGDRLTKLRC